MTKPLKYTIEEFKLAVSSSRSLREALIQLGLNPTGGNYCSARRRIADLSLSTEHFKGQGWAKDLNNPIGSAKPIEYYLVDNGPRVSSYKLKHRLYKEGILIKQCSICFITDWNNCSISLHLDHINGNKYDNRLENLRVLCPNCHSQTSTYAGKNHGKYESSRTKKLGSGLPSPIKNSVKGSPNLSTYSQVVSRPVGPLLEFNLVALDKKCVDCNTIITKRSTRCKSCAGLLNPTKITWPSKEELEKLVWQIPRSRLALELGVSDKAIAKRCKSLGIQQPSRGYWAKLRSLNS